MMDKPYHSSTDECKMSAKRGVGSSEESGRRWIHFSTSLSPYLGFLPRYKVVAESLHGELHGVPQFVAEVAVTKDTVDIQVDIPACREEMKE